MRIQGVIKVISSLLISFFFIYAAVGVELSVIVILLIALYAWLGEYTALWRAGAISEANLDVYERNKLQRIRELVAQKVKSKSATDVSSVKIHIVPSNEANAMAYGFNNVSFTKGAIESCDEMTLCAVFSHEVSHILCLDAVFNRIIFGDITFLILYLMVMSFLSISFIWIIFLVLALFGICKGFISVFITSNLSKGIKLLFDLLQHGSLFIYQAAMGLISRGFEYRADSFSVDLGFGNQLAYFLDRFATIQSNRPKTISEILYASHPDSFHRIQKIKQRQLNKQQ